MECWAEVKSSQGKLLLDLVEGGAHFTCEIDIATGEARLSCDDETVDTKVTFRDQSGQAVAQSVAQTNLRGAGEYHIEFVNADDRINLWINNKLIEFDAASYTRTGIPIPMYDSSEPGDAEPAGVGAIGADVTLSRLKILRDIYYTSVKGHSERSSLENETSYDPAAIERLHQEPERWASAEARAFFEKKKVHTEPMFRLEKKENPAQDQFLPMGDNSPRSLDGRVWDGENYVERDMLIGRAMLIYWPHTKNKPIKYFPNFERMGFIR
jgi:signal peptidase I